MHTQDMIIDRIAMQGCTYIIFMLHKQNVNLSITGEGTESCGLLTLAAAEDAECMRRCKRLQRAFDGEVCPIRAEVSRKYTTPKTKRTHGYGEFHRKAGVWGVFLSFQLYLMLQRLCCCCLLK